MTRRGKKEVPESPVAAQTAYLKEGLTQALVNLGVNIGDMHKEFPGITKGILETIHMLSEQVAGVANVIEQKGWFTKSLLPDIQSLLAAKGVSLVVNEREDEEGFDPEYSWTVKSTGKNKVDVKEHLVALFMTKSVGHMKFSTANTNNGYAFVLEPGYVVQLYESKYNESPKNAPIYITLSKACENVEFYSKKSPLFGALQALKEAQEIASIVKTGSTGRVIKSAKNDPKVSALEGSASSAPVQVESTLPSVSKRSRGAVKRV